MCYYIHNKDKNVSSIDFVIHTMDTFIKKLMADNVEMLSLAQKHNVNYILIEDKYEINIDL